MLQTRCLGEKLLGRLQRGQSDGGTRETQAHVCLVCSLQKAALLGGRACMVGIALEAAE